jgi:hypothetical protein
MGSFPEAPKGVSAAPRKNSKIKPAINIFRMFIMSASFLENEMDIFIYD